MHQEQKTKIATTITPKKRVASPKGNPSPETQHPRGESGNPELQVIAEAEDGVDAVAKAQQLKPDVVLMDIGLPKPQ